MSNLRYFALLFLIISCFVSVQSLAAQDQNSVSNKNEVGDAILFDEFTLINSEDRSARIDGYLVEIIKAAGSRGLIILYCGKVCHYGEIEAHIRGINGKLRLRGFEPKNISVVFGGYKPEFTAEIWIVPAGGKPPLPRPEIPIEHVTFKGNYAWRLEPYECCGLEVSAFPPREVTELPKVIKRFLENAADFEVLMHTREKNGQLVAAMTPHFRPNLRKPVDDQKTRKILLRSFYKASKTGAMGSACYLPSHSIQATDGEKSVEIEICFGCRRYTITGSFGTFIGTLEYENKAENLFNGFLLGDQKKKL